MFAPVGAELRSAAGENGFTLVCNRMTVAAGRTAPGDVNDFDDVRRAQLAHTTFLAQGVVGGVEMLVDTEAAGSDVLGVGLGTGWSWGWSWSGNGEEQGGIEKEWVWTGEG